MKKSCCKELKTYKLEVKASDRVSGDSNDGEFKINLPPFDMPEKLKCAISYFAVDQPDISVPNGQMINICSKNLLSQNQWSSTLDNYSSCIQKGMLTQEQAAGPVQLIINKSINEFDITPAEVPSNVVKGDNTFNLFFADADHQLITIDNWEMTILFWGYN